MYKCDQRKKKRELYFNKGSKKTGISQFSAYALAIFTEYTAWAAFGEVSRSALDIIFDFFLLLANQNRHADDVLNMCIW